MAWNIPLKITLLTTGKRQSAVAAAAGITETRLTKIVTGRGRPTTAERQAIAAALGVSPEVLFGTEAAHRA